MIVMMMIMVVVMIMVVQKINFQIIDFALTGTDSQLGEPFKELTMRYVCRLPWISYNHRDTGRNGCFSLHKLCKEFGPYSGFVMALKEIIASPHRRTGRGGGGGLQPPQILGNSDFLGRKRKFGQSYFLKTFPCFFISLKRQIFSILIWKKSWNQRNNPVTFSRDTHSGCLARDEFLVIGKGITCWFTYLYFFIVDHCTALHWLEWALSSRELIRISFCISARRIVYGREHQQQWVWKMKKWLTSTQLELREEY